MSASSRNQALPRDGWRGMIDVFIGPGATTAELVVQFVPTAYAALMAPWVAAHSSAKLWTRFELFMIALFAFDLVGGVLTNATSAAKRWYHRPGQGAVDHMKFVLLHLFHIAIVAFLFREGDVRFLFGVGSYLLAAAMIILSCPLYLQRPVALGLYMVVLVVDRCFLTPTDGIEWFLPLFFLKLLVSHLLHETAWDPTD